VEGINSMSAIEAISRTVKTMADGTLRLTVDISPVHAQDAFSMFGMPDVPLALARLNIQASQERAQEETIAKEKKEPLTGLALLAVQWCQEPNFWKWINENWDIKPVTDEKGAKVVICSWCEIDSRKELNTDTQAAATFQQDIRAPYMQWLKEQGVIL
jgi:hypothetical protein